MLHCSKGFRWIGCGVLAVWSVSGCSAAGNGSEPDRLGESSAGIWNGTAISEATNAVPKLNVPNSTYCTATLLNARWALTAAHCVKLAVDRQFQKAGVAIGGIAQPYGIVQAPPSTAFSRAKFDAQNRVVAVGSSVGANGNGVLYVTRLSSNGETDTSFNGGSVTIDHPNSNGEGFMDLAFTSSGSIVAMGMATSASGKRTLIMKRFTAAGAVDNAFGSSGTVTTDLSSSQASLFPQRMLIDGSGRIVVTGYAINASNKKLLAILRYTASGAPDGSFGWGGLNFATPGSGADATGADLTIDTSNPSAPRILVAGSVSIPPYFPAVVAAFTNTGMLDTSFAGSGWAAFGNGTSAASTILMQGNKILIGGASQPPDSTLTQATVWRLNNGGSLDTSFGKKTDGTPLNTGAVSISMFGQILSASFSSAVGLSLATGQIRVGIRALAEGVFIPGYNAPAYATLSTDGQLRPDRTDPMDSTGTLYDKRWFPYSQFFVQSMAVAEAANGKTRVLLAGHDGGRGTIVALKPDLVEFNAAADGASAVTGTRNGNSATADRMYLAPGTPGSNVAMVHFPTTPGLALPFGYVQPAFSTTQDIGAMDEKIAVCRGFGPSDANDPNTAGVLREGWAMVYGAGNTLAYPHLTIQPIGFPIVIVPTPQMPFGAEDFGASCLVDGKIAGVMTRDTLGNGALIERSDGFSLWANLLAATP